MSEILVAYFSASGVTAKIAKELAEVFQADLFEICPEKPYTKEDLDWTDKTSRSTVEMQNLSCRPAVKNRAENMDRYKTVFVGFPVWWYREPSIIDTFLDGYDFRGKKIVPFCTSGGSGLGETARRIKELTGADVDKGRRFETTETVQDIKDWAVSVL